MAKNRVEYWFKDEDLGTYLRLPVNPPEINYANPYDIQTVAITKLGEVSIPGERGLKQITFSSFFPRDYNASYCEYEGFPSPSVWFSQIQTWRYARKPIRFIVTGTNINLPMYISEFDVQPERAGAPGDMYYSLTLVEHRPFKASSVQSATTTSTVVATSNRPSSPKVKTKTYKVVKGDSLWKIAKAQYGDGSKWSTIYNANKSVIGANPDKIKPGQKLVIP